MNDFEICDIDNDLDEILLIIENGNDYEIINQSQNKIVPITESDDNVEIEVDLIFSDGESENNTVSYSSLLNVLPVNDIPEIEGIIPGLDFYEDTPFSLTVNDLLIVDPDDSSWSLTIYENQDSPYSLNGNTILSYDNYFGNLTIPIEVNDGESNSGIYNLSIDLIPVNDSPLSLWVDEGVSEFDLFIDEDFGDSTLFNFNEIFSDVDDEELVFNYPSDQNFELFDIELDDSGNLILYSIFNTKNMKNAVDNSYSTATDLANWIVQKLNYTFRDAYQLTGKIVKYAINQNRRLDQITLKELKSFDKNISESARTVLNSQNSIMNKTSFGGSSPQSVKKSIQYAIKKYL